MKAKVYFSREITPEKVVALYRAVGRELPGKVAVKLHSGEQGNQNFLGPDFWRPMIEAVHGTVVECNTAYEGERNTTEKHRRTMIKHGWSTNFDVDILDAEGPDLELAVPNGRSIQKNFVGKDIANYDSMLVLSHFKGHPMGGFGGALKQLSIGCASSYGKAYIHGAGEPEKIGTADHDSFLDAMADAASSVAEYFKDKTVFINVMKNMSVDCDCCAVAEDPAVKGMWNVPKYSNPDGIIYSDETIERIARLKPAAPDFLLMWDNAYCIHEFEGEFVPFPDILSLCEKYGNADMVFEFASTSKITLPGAGVACFACSEANMEYMEKLINVQIISYDKINQLRHVKYLKDKAHTLELMKKHAAIMGPKFKAVTETLAREVGPLGLATWHDPKGGYFVSVNTLPGLAKRTLALCKEAGVIMTSAGATFPYGVDPKDSNIRVAPSLPPVEELQQAMEVFCCCLKLAALEQLK